MKTLIIVRHAKSSWDNPMLSDHDRPLLEMGKKRTRLVVNKLQEMNIQPDLIISSSAIRAFETAQYVAKGLNYPKDAIKASESFYMASTREILNEFFDMPDRFNTLMVVGHNPTLTHLANLFLSTPLDNLPTSGVVLLHFKTDHWDQIHLSKPVREEVITPKSLKKKH
jgi:phosphohistidine phosphatase